jgi:ABC-type sugar transport system substrate-binding protein
MRMRSFGFRFRRAGWALAALVASIAVAACGGSSHKSKSSSTTPPAKTTSTTSSSSGKISAQVLAALQARVKQAEGIPKWTPPGPPVSAAAIKGASITVFPINSEIDACNQQAKDFTALGDSLGAHVKLINDSGQPSQWQTAVEGAVAAHDKAVVMLCGVIPGVLGPQLSAAKQAGVIVVDGNYNDTNNYTGLDGETAVQTTQSLGLDVADAIVNLKGKPLHALFVDSYSVVQGPAAAVAVKEAVNRICPSSCSVTQVTVPIQNWATALQSDVSSALTAHPDINAVIIAFDGMTPFVLPAIQSSHISGLHIYTWGGGRPIEKLMLAPNPVVVADPGPDEDWDAYDAMDQVIRLANHKPAAPVTKEVDPDRFWVPANVKQFFGPGGTYGNAGFGGNAFINGFLKLWGAK